MRGLKRVRMNESEYTDYWSRGDSGGYPVRCELIKTSATIKASVFRPLTKYSFHHYSRQKIFFLKENFDSLLIIPSVVPTRTAKSEIT